MPKRDGMVLVKAERAESIALYGMLPSRNHVDHRKPISENVARKLAADVEDPITGDAIKSGNERMIPTPKRNPNRERRSAKP